MVRKIETQIRGNLNKSFLLRMLVVGAKQCKDGSTVTDVCFAKLQLKNVVPAFVKSFQVHYSFSLMSTDRPNDFKTQTFHASSSDLVLLAGNEVELLTRNQLKANRASLIVDGAITVVCHVRIIRNFSTFFL